MTLGPKKGGNNRYIKTTQESEKTKNSKIIKKGYCSAIYNICTHYV